jgi:hypothetical protein
VLVYSLLANVHALDDIMAVCAQICILSFKYNISHETIN